MSIIPIGLPCSVGLQKFVALRSQASPIPKSAAQDTPGMSDFWYSGMTTVVRLVVLHRRCMNETRNRKNLQRKTV